MVRFDFAPPPPPWGRKIATVGMTDGKSFQIRYDTPCPALEAALHAQPIIWYFAVPFGRPLSFACAIHMYTPVGGKAPSVPLGASPRSPWEPQGAAPARWCGARVSVCLPVMCRLVLCLVGYVGGVSVPQCGVWRLGWLGSCSGVGALRPACRHEPAGSLVQCGGPLVPCVPLVGVWRKGILVSVEAPLLLFDACNFLGRGECVPRTIPAGYMSQIRPSVPGI